MVWNEEVPGKFVAALAWKDSRRTINNTDSASKLLKDWNQEKRLF